MAREDWRRYAAPAAFLAVVTIAVVLIRSGLESGGRGAAPPRTSPPPAHVATTTAAPPTTTVATRPRPPARTYWTVQAGDTFGTISVATGVPVATIEQLNPGVSSNALHIGEKVRTR